MHRTFVIMCALIGAAMGAGVGWVAASVYLMGVHWPGTRRFPDISRQFLNGNETAFLWTGLLFGAVLLGCLFGVAAQLYARSHAPLD
jgi:hypothetical protein